MYRRRRERASWDLGDWLVRGHVLDFDPLFKRSVAITGYTQRFLYVLKRTAELFPPDVRSYAIAWTVHRDLGRENDPEKRQTLFARAVAERWNSGTIARYFVEHPPTPAPKMHPARVRPKNHEYKYRTVRCPNCAHEFPALDHKVKP